MDLESWLRSLSLERYEAVLPSDVASASRACVERGARNADVPKVRGVL